MSVMDASSVPSGSSVPLQYGQHASTGTAIVSPIAPAGSSLRRNGPSPGLRPGDFGLALCVPLEKWRRRSSPPAPQILVLPPQLFYLSPQFDDDLNQFSATDCFQVCQATECTIFVSSTTPFKSGDESPR
jgi:hypothetical protein